MPMRPGIMLVGLLVAFATATTSAKVCVKAAPGTWVAMATAGEPTPTVRNVLRWVGGRLVVFGTSGGGLYDPCTNKWTKASTSGMPPQLVTHGVDPIIAGDSLVWLYPGTETNMSVHSSTIAAAIFDVRANTWRLLPLSGELAATRAWSTTAWTGRSLLVWGGVTEKKVKDGVIGVTLDTGVRVDLATATTTPIARPNAPTPRSTPATVWTGKKLFVWGGTQKQSNPYQQCTGNDTCITTNTGALYDPADDKWTAISAKDAPSARAFHDVLWTGTKVVVWGGHSDGVPGRDSTLLLDGGVYDPATDGWLPIKNARSQFPKAIHSRAHVDGEYLIVKSNSAMSVYDLAKQIWTSIEMLNGPVSPARGLPGFQTLTLPKNETAGAITRLDAKTATWKTATLPVAGAPRGPCEAGECDPTPAMAWTADRVIVWGSVTSEVDPHGSNGCEGHSDPNRGCDPYTPMKQVARGGGAMIVPQFR